jgi:predicted sugar kinase
MGSKKRDSYFLNPTKFIAGTVFVDIKNKPFSPHPKYSQITIKYPSRLDAACTDPGKIFQYSTENLYAAGQINFCIDICKEISVRIRRDKNIEVFGLPKRKALMVHAAKLMLGGLGISVGFNINIKNDLELRHCGLGSSASIIQGIGATINELYGNPIATMDLIRYLAGNHGEEIDGDDEHLVQVQSVGGSGVCGHFCGGLIIMTGRAMPIIAVDLPTNIKIVFGVPSKYAHPDANNLICKEVKNISKFKKVSKNFAEKIAYRLLNEAIPELLEDNYKPMKDFIFDYRWDMGSIENCAYAYPSIMDIAEKMRPLKNDSEIEFVALSTAGPGFFIATKNVARAKRIFADLNMTTYVTKIHNEKYQIIKKEVWN